MKNSPSNILMSTGNFIKKIDYFTNFSNVLRNIVSINLCFFTNHELLRIIILMIYVHKNKNTHN